MFPKKPKFKKGDLVWAHNHEQPVTIDYCWPATEPGKSHRYSFKDSRGRKFYGSGKGYYEQVFKKLTKKEVKTWEERNSHGTKLAS